MKSLFLKPKGNKKREARDLALYKDYQKLMEVEGQSRTEVNNLLMEKYDIDSQGTIYTILHRVEDRLKQEQEGQV